MILDETIALLKTQYSEKFFQTTIQRVQLGPFFAAVQLSSGFCGLSSMEAASLNCCQRNRSREITAFSPGHISGQKLFDLFEFRNEPGTLDVVKLAAINAASQELLSASAYTIIQNQDPIGFVNLNEPKSICLVGAFHSYMHKIANSRSNLTVLELNEYAVPPEFKKYYRPTANASEVFQESDIIIVTGSSLANNTFDQLFSLMPQQKQVIVVGPSAGLIPDVLFSRGVHTIGTTRVVDTDLVFRAIAEGAAGYHLFMNGAQKICILKNAG